MDATLSPDLMYLAWSAALAAVLWVPYIIERVLNQGLVQAVGYPDNPPEPAKWAQRAQRAHLNLLENLPIFAALVLVAHLAGAADETSALGATLFFWARLVQALVMLAGVPWVRTLAFVVSWIGMVLVFVAIVT